MIFHSDRSKSIVRDTAQRLGKSRHAINNHPRLDKDVRRSPLSDGVRYPFSKRSLVGRYICLPDIKNPPLMPRHHAIS